MSINYQPIISTEIYQKDKQRLYKTGGNQSWQIWFLILMIFIPLLWPLLAYKIYRFFVDHKQNGPLRQEAMKDFATTNGFTFESLKSGFVSNDDYEKMSLKPNLPFVAESLFNTRKISGSLNGCNFNYVFSSANIKKGNNTSQFLHNIMIVDLPIDVPKVYINAKNNNLAGLDASPTNFEKIEGHSLEGDFHLYFDVKIEKNDHINMYRTLTPEVMDLLKSNSRYDIWINARQLVILTFADSEGRYFAAIPEVFQIASKLLEEIDVIAREIN
jgi:hypothetical protein